MAARRRTRRFAVVGAIVTVAATIVTFQAMTDPTSAATTDPPSRPSVPTQLLPSFPVLGTPGYVEWQGAISSAREYVSAADQPIVPGGDFAVDYQYEYHGGWLGVLCPSTATSCGLVEPHPPAPAPAFQLGGEWAFLGAAGDPVAYGTHSDQDVGVPVGAIISRLRVPSGNITEEVATRTVRTGPNHADVWYTVVRHGRLTFRLPATLPGGSLFLGLNNHPSSTLSIFGGAYRGATSPYRRAAYEQAAWWTGGSLLDVRSPTAAPSPIQAPPPESPPPTTYVALGDSYSAGEGLADYLSGSDTASNTCHRSSKAYSQLLQVDLIRSFHACSQVRTQAYYESTGQSQEPAQRDYLDDSTALVTMTLGGNDLGWSGVLVNCTKVEAQVTHNLVLPHNRKKCLDELDGMSAQITPTVEGTDVQGVRHPGLRDVYRDILARAPRAQVRILGYPPLFPDRGKAKSGCRIARLNVVVPPAPVPPTQLVLASDVVQRAVGLQALFNSEIREAIARLRAESPDNQRLAYVDLEGPFGGASGHTIDCGDRNRPQPWINAVKLSSSAALKLTTDLASRKGRFSTDLYDVYSASFHPKAIGQRVMADAVQQSL